MVKNSQYSIYWVDLNPTIGAEINKVRPCLVVSPNELNKYLETIVIIPLTSQIHDYPWRMSFKLEDKTAEAALDQIKTIDKRRIKDFIGKLSDEEIEILKTKIKEMFVD